MILLRIFAMLFAELGRTGEAIEMYSHALCDLELILRCLSGEFRDIIAALTALNVNQR